MGSFRFALVSPMGSALELMVSMVQPGEAVIAGDGRRLLVLDVVDLSDRDGDVRAILDVEELSSEARRRASGPGRRDRYCARPVPGSRRPSPSAGCSRRARRPGGRGRRRRRLGRYLPIPMRSTFGPSSSQKAMSPIRTPAMPTSAEPIFAGLFSHSPSWRGHASTGPSCFVYRSPPRRSVACGCRGGNDRTTGSGGG